MKKKTYKLQKLENNRFSILTDDLEHCFFCNQQPVDMHEIYGGANRRISMQNGFCVPLCRKCHEFVTINRKINLVLKKTCQELYQWEEHTKDDFMKLIGKNYLEY